MRLIAALALAMATAATPFVAHAQRLAIAAIVNDDVVTSLDLAQRVELVIRTSNMPDTDEQRARLRRGILDRLVEESLRMQEAKANGVAVTDEEMAAAISQIEKNNNLAAGGFDAFVAKVGLPRAVFEAQIRADLAWQKLVARRFRPTISISDEQIDAVLKRIEDSQGTTEYRVAEIVLDVENEENEKEVRQLAERLMAQMRSGANFRAVAAQFSSSASAAAGGDIGWVTAAQLSDDVAAVVTQLRPGQLAGPLAEPGAFRIIGLIARRVINESADPETEVSLRQLLLPINDGADPAQVKSQVDLARQVAEVSETCDEFAEFANELGTVQPPEPTRIRLADLNDQLRAALSGVEAGAATDPTVTPAGVQVVMVCARDDGASTPQRDRIRRDLVRERLDQAARRYSRDLRREAFIDIRIG